MLKRILATALAAAMIFGLASVAFAGFSDTAGNANEKAIVKLASLGLLKGYEDGTFKPAGSITRAEFAAVIVRALGYENSAKLLTGAPAFKDVAGAQWAWGYINVASAQSIIKGYPDGSFAPNANVTVAEAVTMIVRALGRDEQATGIWPAGHIMVASQIGMLPTDLPGVDVASTRAIVAQLVANVIDKPFAYKDKDGQWQEHDESFLSRNSSTTLKNRLVKEVNTTDNEVTVEKLTDDPTDFATVRDVAASCQFVGGANLATMKGQKVDILFDEDGYAIYIGATSTSGISGTVTAVDKINKTITVGGKVYTVKDTATAYYNGTLQSGDAVAKITNLKDATVNLVLDSTGKVTYLDAVKLATEGKLLNKKTVYTADGPVNYITVEGVSGDRPLASTVKIVRNGAGATFADLVINESLKFAEIDGEVTYIDAYAMKVTGVLQEKTSINNHTTYKVNDVVFVVALTSLGDDVSTGDTGTSTVYPGDTINLTLNRDGKVVTVARQTSTAVKVTLQSKSARFDTAGKVIKTVTLSDGSVITVDDLCTFVRNGLTTATFDSLAAGDLLVIGYTSGKATSILAFSNVTGYIRTVGTTTLEVYSRAAASGGSAVAVLTPNVGFSTLSNNGMQTVVTSISNFAYRDEIKVVGWTINSSSDYYPNMLIRRFSLVGVSTPDVDGVGYRNGALVVKGTWTDGTNRFFLVRTNADSDIYLKLTATSIAHRSDAVIDSGTIAIGDKVKFLAASGSGTSSVPYVVSFIVAAADTTAPAIATNTSVTPNVPYDVTVAVSGTTHTVTFYVTENVWVSAKVYNADGVLIKTIDAVEKHGPSDSAGYRTDTVAWDQTVNTGSILPNTGSKVRIVLKFQDYAGNIGDPVSVETTIP